MPRLLPLAAALTFLAACDSASVPPPTAPLQVYDQTASVVLPTDATPLAVSMSDEGIIRAVGDRSSTEYGVYAAGLWLGGTQGGAQRTNLVWYGYSDTSGEVVYERGTYTTDCSGAQSGLFSLDADTTYTGTDAWPRALGAPVTADGAPRVYGDRMTWASFCSNPYPTTPTHAQPLQGIRVNTAVFGYDRSALSGVTFVRYEITNTGDQPISDLRAGFWADADAAGSEAVGYNTEAGLSYGYSLRRDNAGAYRQAAVFGLALLDTPGDAGLGAHRIMRKERRIQPEFGEYDVTTQQQLSDILNGLSNAGDPMINPVTGSATQFAFSGDPFAGTGWRDGLGENGEFFGNDIRQMLSTGSSSLAPGASTTFTAVWLSSMESSPQASYQTAQSRLAAIRANPSLWRF